MQEKHNDTGFILVPADEAVRPAEGYALYYLHRSACSRGYKLVREREESSQVPCALGLIETSANIERCSGRETVFIRQNEALPPPFIDQGGENYTCWTSTGLPFSLLIWGRTALVPVAERCGARHRAWSSSL